MSPKTDPNKKPLTFGHYVQSNIALDADSIDYLVRHCRRIKISRGDFLLRKDMTCRHTFFVEQGLLKKYTIDSKGREHILLFAPENWLVCNVETLFFGKPSSYFIEAIEDSTVLLIDGGTMEMLQHTYAQFADFRQQLLYSHVHELERRVSQLMGDSAEERYLDFMKRYPSLAMRLPQVEVAAYLSVAPESLSRVRRELASRGCKPKNY
ncbi:MAG: Crp/Fnr family transcriptional regulator [Prevotella sp.]|jgi:CRP-like cAMP-binding protein